MRLCADIVFRQSFPKQLVIHAGSGFEGSTREQDFANFQEIDPIFDEIGMSVGLGQSLDSQKQLGLS